MSLELGRRLVHASGAVLPAAYLLDSRVFGTDLFAWPVVRAVAAAGLVAVALLEAARLYGGLEHAIYDRLTREYERDSVAGYALYVLGGTITVFAFGPRVAVPALFMLTLADPVSGMLSGDRFRTVARPRVFVGMFTVSLLLAVSFVPPPVAVAGAAGATVADGIKPVVAGRVVDDNLTIPVFGATAMWAALSIFG
jgi:dolichol kinase